VPRVLAWCDDTAPLGFAFQVMERAPGRALLRAGNNEADASLLAQVLPELGSLLLGSWPQQLARLHVELHRLEAEPLLRALEAAGFDPRRIRLEARLDRLEANIETCALRGLRPGLEWLRKHAPAEHERLAICHGDFFANQVFRRRGELRVLDWSEALVAPAEIDAGIVKCGIEAAPAALPGPLDPLALGVQRWLVRRFLAAYRLRRPLDPALLRFGQVLQAVSILASVFERRLVLAGALAGEAGPNPYDSASGVQRLVAYAASVARVRLEPPPG